MAFSRPFNTSQDVSDLLHDIEEDVLPPAVQQWPPISDDSIQAEPSLVAQRPRVRLPAMSATDSQRPHVSLPLKQSLATLQPFQQKDPFLTTRGREIALESPKPFGSH